MTVALITGASSGIGRAVALRLATRGDDVGLVARGRERLEVIAGECRARGVNVSIAAADVGRRDEVEAAVRSIAADLGPIDVLVNNAGMPAGVSDAYLDPDLMERVIDVNLLGALWAAAEVLPGMRERRRGAIVNVASVAGLVGVPGSAVYSASKFGLVGWSEALSAELARDGVRVGVVNPGPVRTPSWPHPGVSERLMATPDDVALAVLRCIDGRAREVTVPRWYAVVPALRALAPPAYRMLLTRLARRAARRR